MPKRNPVLLVLLLTCFIAASSHAQVNLNYQQPNSTILDLVDAPLPPIVDVNSEGSKALLMYRYAYKSIEELSQVEVRLAGLRINPRTNMNSRQRYVFDIQVLDIGSGEQSKIEGLPEDGQFSNVRWSKDESKLALTHSENEGVSLWMVDLATNKAKKLTKPRLNGNMGSVFRWMGDNQTLLVKLLPEDQKSLVDSRTSVPTGPTVSVNSGKKAQNRTYQDLLKNPVDEQNFESLAQSELYLIDLDGNAQQWMEKDMYRDFSLSPDGQYVLINIVQRPFSYLVPYYRFPTLTEVYSVNGEHVSTVQHLPLIEDLPKGFMATHKMKRNIAWRSDQPSTLYWVMALDGGDPNTDAEFRDGLYSAKVPLDGSEQLVAKTINRFSFVNWGNDDVAIVHDSWFNNRNTKSYLVDPDDLNQPAILLVDRNYQDRYSDPGDFITAKNEWGREVLLIDEDQLYLDGPGYSSRGVHPFIDQLDLTSMSKKRLYQSNVGNRYERIRSIIDLKNGKVMVSLEGPTEFPNFYLRNINSGSLVPITDFDNPFKSIQGLHKELIQYKREDGLDLSGTLYLPSDYDKSSDEKLPMLLWAYPVEYKDKSSAGQITSSEFQFTYPSYGSPIFWAARGYAVLDRAAFPIVGEGDQEPNDSFRGQLVANGKAAIDAVDNLGYIDRSRVGVGGHSYGAFMTANLLSHSDLFAAGIARSGAYNRTLTPFGFQREERSYWEAPEVYYTMSPFMHADKMKTPLLLIHGEADNNSGTYPMQSERYFNALKGLGATVRLVMLPKESHGYAARESILHMLWEQDQWLEKYVKNKGKKELQP